MKDETAPAFPGVTYNADGFATRSCGLTKREWMATELLQGLLANPKYADGPFKMNGKEMALDIAAVTITDAMLKSLAV